MKRVEELGISPMPWIAKQDSGYDMESGDFNTSDTVYDANGEVISDWANGETYGEVHPNAEADARLIAAAPELYKALYDDVTFYCEHCLDVHNATECPQKSGGTCQIMEWRKLLEKAGGVE